MNFILMNKNKNITVAMNEPQKIWSLEEFNPEYPLVMLITGWDVNCTDNLALNVIWSVSKCNLI